MEIEFVCYGTVRDAIGQKTVTREVADDTTVGQAVFSLGEEFENLGPLLFGSAGELRGNINVLRNEQNIRTLYGPDTPLSVGDTVAIAPGVAGGEGTVTADNRADGGDWS